MKLRLKSVVAIGLPLLFAFSAAVGWLSSRNILFRLSEIHVNAPDEGLATSIRRKFSDELGRSLFAISLHKIEEGARAFPAVKSIAIHRRWPSQLVIDVELKKAVGVLFREHRLWTVDAGGFLIEPVTRPEALPLMKGLPDDADTRAEFFAWLEHVRGMENGALDFGSFDEVQWDSDRGLILRQLDGEVEIELGFDGFAQAWARAEQAAGLLKARGMRANRLDATYRNRVVVRAAARLPILGNGLNLKELVHRAEAR